MTGTKIPSAPKALHSSDPFGWQDETAIPFVQVCLQGQTRFPVALALDSLGSWAWGRVNWCL